MRFLLASGVRSSSFTENGYAHNMRCLRAWGRRSWFSFWEWIEFITLRCGRREVGPFLFLRIDSNVLRLMCRRSRADVFLSLKMNPNICRRGRRCCAAILFFFLRTKSHYWRSVCARRGPDLEVRNIRLTVTTVSSRGIVEILIFWNLLIYIFERSRSLDLKTTISQLWSFASDQGGGGATRIGSPRVSTS